MYICKEEQQFFILPTFIFEPKEPVQNEFSIDKNYLSFVWFRIIIQWSW